MKHLLRGCFIICTALAAAFACAPASAQTSRGEKSFGPRAGYVSRNSTALAGLAFQYSFSRHVRIAPEIDLIFRNRDMDGFGISFNTHFPISIDSKGRAAFYPVAGINFTSWGLHGVSPDDAKDVTSHTNCIGLNAGAGIEYRVKQSLKLSLEARYTLMRHYPTAQVAAGIAFVF